MRTDRHKWKFTHNLCQPTSCPSIIYLLLDCIGHRVTIWKNRTNTPAHFTSVSCVVVAIMPFNWKMETHLEKGRNKPESHSTFSTTTPVHFRRQTVYTASFLNTPKAVERICYSVGIGVLSKSSMGFAGTLACVHEKKCGNRTKREIGKWNAQ